MDEKLPLAAANATARFQILSLGSNAGMNVRDYKKRKLHKKTKSGCSACKAKRVKCDETRPICVRCQRNDRYCTYGQQITSSSQSTTQSDLCGFSTLSAITVDPYSTLSALNGTTSIHLMHHLQRHWPDIFGVARGFEIVLFSKSNKLVRDTALAMAASHLRHLSPRNQQHRIAEHFQQNVAIQHFQTVLRMPRDQLGQPGVDGLMLSGMLLNVMAFALPASEADNGGLDPSASWVFNPKEDLSGWLVLQVGLRHLLISMHTYIEMIESFLRPIILGDEEQQIWLSQQNHPGLESLPNSWVTIFELDGGDGGCDYGGNDSMFQAPLIVLARLRDVKPTGTHIFYHFTLAAKLNSGIRELLYHRDERALWLFGYWLGLMCRFEGKWWCEQRVRRDYTAISLWLEKLQLHERPGIEGLMWSEMMQEFKLAPIYVELDDFLS